MDVAFPCPFLVGADMELCARPRGHRGRHKPGRGELPEITGRTLERLNRRFGHIMADKQPWWRRKARCPSCRTVIDGVERGAPIGPILVAYGQLGPVAEVISQYEIRFTPCGHQFLRVMRAKDFR
jgi:hypothetical protein